MFLQARCEMDRQKADAVTSEFSNPPSDLDVNFMMLIISKAAIPKGVFHGCAGVQDVSLLFHLCKNLTFAEFISS